MEEVDPLVLVCTKETTKDGVGMHWEHSSIQEIEKRLIMYCQTQEIGKLIFLVI